MLNWYFPLTVNSRFRLNGYKYINLNSLKTLPDQTQEIIKSSYNVLYVKNYNKVRSSLYGRLEGFGCVVGTWNTWLVIKVEFLFFPPIIQRCFIYDMFAWVFRLSYVRSYFFLIHRFLFLSRCCLNLPH